MKKNLFLAAALCSVAVLSSCKSNEAAYRKAYEAALAQETTSVETTTVTVPQTTVVETPTVTETTETVTVQPDQTQDADMRTINGDMKVVSGSALNTFSVVVGSFTLEANADGLARQLANKGYSSRVVKTNETINGRTGWYRVVADSFNDKASARSCRDKLSSEYQGAWLLYSK